MGRNSSGVRGGLQPGDGVYKGKIEAVEPLSAIKNKQLYGEVMSAISRYHSVLGVRQRVIKLADLSDETLGVHVTIGGKSGGIFLNKNEFKNSTKSDIIKHTKQGYDSGWHTKTNKPVAHTVTHELGHATWNNKLEGANYKAAGKEIRYMYRQWKSDTKKSGYGRYATSNVNEFWAETLTKAVHGKADKYTRKAKSIIKRYNL